MAEGDPTPQHIEKAGELARKGLNNKGIAEEFGISTRTLTTWGKKQVGFRDAIKHGRAMQDEKLEKAMYERAYGYEYDEIREIFEANEDGELVLVKREVFHRHMPGHDRLQIFCATNRIPHKWSLEKTKSRGDVNVHILNAGKEVAGRLEKLMHASRKPKQVEVIPRNGESEDNDQPEDD